MVLAVLSKLPFSTTKTKFSKNAAPLAMCLPSCSYSSDNNANHPNLSDTAITKIRVGNILRIRRLKKSAKVRVPLLNSVNMILIIK